MRRDTDGVADGVRAALDVIKVVRAAGHEEVVSRSFRVAGSSAEYVALAMAIYRAGIRDDSLRHFRPEVEPSAIVSHLKEQCEEGAVERSHVGCLSVLARVEVDWPWTDLVGTLRSRLASGTTLEGKEIIGDIECLMVLNREASVPEARSALEELVSSGHLMNHLYQAQSATDPIAMADCVAPMLALNPSGAQSSSVGNSSGGQQAYNNLMANPDSQREFTKALAGSISRFDLIDLVLPNATSTDSIKPCVDAVLKTLVNEEYDFRPLKPEQVISNYPYIAQALSEEEMAATIAHADEDRGIRNRLREGTFNPQMADLYMLVYRGTGDAEFRDFLRIGLTEVDAETWVKEFNRSGSLVELTLYLIEEAPDIRLSNELQEALLTHAKSVLEGGRKPAKFESRWGTLLSALNEHARETFLRDLRDEVLNRRNESSQPLLALYEASLLDAHLEEKADDTVRGLFREMVDRQVAEELSWIATVLRDRPQVFERAPKASQRAFKDKVENAFKGEEVTEEARSAMEEIARLLELELPEAEEAEKAEE
jgi:hypothetical protein